MSLINKPRASVMTKTNLPGVPAGLTDFNPGDRVWVQEKDDKWVLELFGSYDDKTRLVHLTNENGEEHTLPASKDFLNANTDVVPDMTALTFINAPSVLFNMEERFNKQTNEKVRIPMYTWMSNVLLAVNPFLNDLEDPKLEDFFNVAERRPHPYAIAEMAFRQMTSKTSDAEVNQSIVISGESGAGKTVSAKIVLGHLTVRGGAGGTEGLDKRLLDSNPITEAFGNSKTLRNNNSSRFGKFMKIQFTDDGKFSLKGGGVRSYLLEKSRVVYQIKDERNFHVFYMLLAGDAKAKLGLGDPMSYNFLKQSGCPTAPGFDDKAEHALMMKAMTTVGVVQEQQDLLLEFLASILHLGNIEFDDQDNGAGDEAIVKGGTEAALKAAANALGVEEAALLKVMCEREVKTMGEVITVKKDSAASSYSRDAISKELFGMLFDWIVLMVNKSLGEGPASLPFIGVLDIFGFETFERNDFEQLLINYTNEVLQTCFNQQVFIAETELYRSEGISVDPVSFPDNRECIELISSKPNGVLPILDAESKNPKPSDLKFNKQLHKMHAYDPFCPKPHPKAIAETFIVKHFAGDVTYTVGKFINKNSNAIPPDVVGLYHSSKLTSLAEMDKVLPVKPDPKGRTKKPPTVGTSFVKDIKELVTTLNSTRCSFIKCIKPNFQKEAGLFDQAYVMDQLNCQGILQTCEVLKVGLPTRLPYADIVAIMKPNLPADILALFANEPEQAFVQGIFWAMEVPQDAFRCGLTKVFFRTGKMAMMEKIMSVDFSQPHESGKPFGEYLKDRLFKYVQRKRWRRGLAKVVLARTIASNWTQMYQEIKAAKAASVLTIQRMARGLAGRKRYKALYEAEQERKRKEAEEARRKAEEEERKRKEAEAAQKAAEEEAKKKAEAEAAAQKAAAEAKAKAEAAAVAAAADVAKKEEAEKLQKEAEAAQKKADVEAKAKAAAEADIEANKKIQAEAMANMSTLQAEADKAEAAHEAAQKVAEAKDARQVAAQAQQEEGNQAKYAVENEAAAENLVVFDRLSQQLRSACQISMLPIPSNKERALIDSKERKDEPRKMVLFAEDALVQMVDFAQQELMERQLEKESYMKEKSGADHINQAWKLQSEHVASNRRSIIPVAEGVTATRAHSEKATRLMKVNELVAEDRLTMEEAEKLTELIFDCPVEGPFPDLPGLPGTATTVTKSIRGSIRGDIVVQKEETLTVQPGEPGQRMGMKLGILQEEELKMVIVLALPKDDQGNPQRAAKAGVKMGDRILAIDGESFDPEQAVPLLSQKGSSEMQLTVLRADKEVAGLRDRAKSVDAAREAAEKMQSLFDAFSSTVTEKGKDSELMSQQQLVDFARECKLLSKKLTAAEVDLIFQRVKVGKKKGIDFRAFEEACRHMAMKTQMPYQELIENAEANLRKEQERKLETPQMCSMLLKMPKQDVGSNAPLLTGASKSWKQRWFVLGKNELTYYEKENSKKKKGVFRLDKNSMVEKLSKPPPDLLYCFRISTSETVLMTMAKSEDQMEQWIDAIHTVVDNLQKHHSGYLTKKATTGGASWDRRYFVLEDSTLTYYSSETAKVVKGIINLTHDTFIERDAIPDGAVRANCMSITTPDKTLFAFSETPEDMNVWCDQLEKHVEELSADVAAGEEYEVWFGEGPIGLGIINMNVMNVHTESEGERRGVTPGSIVLSVNGKPPTSDQELVHLISSSPRPMAMRFRRPRSNKATKNAQANDGCVIAQLRCCQPDCLHLNNTAFLTEQKCQSCGVALWEIIGRVDDDQPTGDDMLDMDEEEGDIDLEIKSGELCKFPTAKVKAKAAKGKVQKRFFVLSPRKLQYSATEKTKNSPKGMIQLRPTDTLDLDAANLTMTLTYTSGKEKQGFLAIKASSEEELNEWADAIKTTISKVPAAKAAGAAGADENKLFKYKDGQVLVKTQGSMQGYDEETGENFTEYLMLVNWRPDPDFSETWTVSARWSEITSLNESLKKRFGSEKSFPQFPAKVMASTKEQRVQIRIEKYKVYVAGLFQMFEDKPDLVDHARDLQEFFELHHRVPKIKRAFAMQKELAEQNGDMAGAKVQVSPMTEEEIQQAGTLVQQTWRLLKAAQNDVRSDDHIQACLANALSILPQLEESAKVGPFTQMEMVPFAQQYIVDLSKTVEYYNDQALLFLLDELRFQLGLSEE
jgi:myosin heavy subunit